MINKTSAIYFNYNSRIARHTFLCSFIFVTLVFFDCSAYGQTFASSRFKLLTRDSSLHILADQKADVLSDQFDRSSLTHSLPAVTPAKEQAEANESDQDLTRSQERRRLLSYLKSLKVENSPAISQSRAKFYYHLANTFARLRLYPLAMKCFLKTLPKPESSQNELVQTDSLQRPIIDNDTTQLEFEAGVNLSINSKDDSLISSRALVLNRINSQVNSQVITYARIHQVFADGKRAVAYALLFHVKQPVRGKRKIFVLNNVGHTFITLIKYNADSTYTSASFGFYPKKDNLLSATPLIPTTSSVFKDDAGHDWDEVLGKFISKRRFEKIQSLISKYDGIKYNLSKNNCTDFGIKAAELAGITIQETYGTWPLGKGNNPAVTGQSILEHKFSNSDRESSENIFVDSLAPTSK